MMTWNGFHALDLRGSRSSPTGIHSGSFTPPTWHAPPCFLAGTRWQPELQAHGPRRLWHPHSRYCDAVGAMATHTCARPMRTHDFGGTC